MQQVIEKLDAIEQANQAKIAEAVEIVKSEFAQQLSALEAKIAEVQAPAIISAPAKTIKSEVNRSVKSQLKEFVGKTNNLEKEIRHAVPVFRLRSDGKKFFFRKNKNHKIS